VLLLLLLLLLGSSSVQTSKQIRHLLLVFSHC
jgi:hypothetical protein